MSVDGYCRPHPSSSVGGLRAGHVTREEIAVDLPCTSGVPAIHLLWTRAASIWPWLATAGLDAGLAVERRSSAAVPRRADLARQAVRAGLRLLRGSPVSGQFEVRRLIMTATPDAAGPDAAGWEIPADDVRG